MPSPPPKSDPYIIYGRGGAGNIHHRSTIRSAWRSLKTSPSTSPPVSLSVSPDNYYAAWNAKSEDPAKRRRAEGVELAGSGDDSTSASLKRNTSSGSLSLSVSLGLFRSNSRSKCAGGGAHASANAGSDGNLKREGSSGSLFSLGSGAGGSRSHNGLSGLSRMFSGKRRGSVGDASLTEGSVVESVREEDAGGEEEDEGIVMGGKGKGKRAE